MLEFVALLILTVVLAGLFAALHYTRKGRDETGDDEGDSNEERASVNGRVERGIRRRRGGLARMRRAAAAATSATSAGSDRNVNNHNNNDDERGDESGSYSERQERGGRGGGTDDGNSDGEIMDGSMMQRQKKKKKKEANREAKREAQEARRAALEAAREREEEAAEARQREEEFEAAQEAAAEEVARKAAEEKARKEQEEYDQWKNLISVENAGDAAEQDKLEDPAMLQRFCTYVREHKVVILEDLAAEFDLHTEDVVDRLTSLEENGTLSGFFDDRGKFIYVSHDEMVDVAKLIKRRGRISIQDLAAESSKLLHLDTVATTS